MISKLSNTLVFKIIIVTTCLLVASSLIELSISTPKIQLELKNLLAKEQHALASSLAMQLDQDIRKRISLLSNMSMQLSNEIIQNNPNQWLAEKQAIFPIFSGGFIIVDKSGQEILPQSLSTNDRTPKDYSHADWFIDSKKSSSVVIGKPHRAAPEKKAQLVMAIALKDKNDQLLAVLAGIEFLENKGIFGNINNTLIGQTGTSLLISPKEKVFVASSMAGMILTTTPKKGTNILHDRALKGFRGTEVTINAFGVKELATIVSIPITQWFLVVRLPTKEAFEFVYKTRSVLILSAVGHAIISIILILIMLLYFLNPLKQAAKTIHKMSVDGKNLKPISIMHHDEVGTLIDGINYLLKKIKKNEELLILKRDRANTANEAKSQFLANMSHELRTPLNAILGFSRMMGQDSEASTSQLDRLAIINRSGEHLLDMINEVLDLAKIEAGQMELESRGFDLQQLLEDMNHIFGMRAENAGLNFDLVIDPGLARYIESDAGKLRQILINLLGNAVKFTRQGGFSVRARTLPMEDDSRMVTLQLEVEDSGSGISSEQLERIFEPFFQGGNQPNSAKGAGLGLAISKSFIDLMGGKTHVESEPDKGTLFRIELPVALTDALGVGEQETHAPTVVGLESKQVAWRILVVEDNPDNRMLLSGLLAQVGFEVREAKNGEEAIAAFKQWHPHFIWMDIRMPVMDGYEATRRIRSLPGGNDVRIVALTASVLQHVEDEAIGAGCDDVIRKPYQEQEIFQCMLDQIGVSFIYQKSILCENSPQTGREIDDAVFANMSGEILKSLLEAVENKDQTKLDGILVKLRDTQPVLVQLLSALAKDRRYDQILELLL